MSATHEDPAMAALCQTLSWYPWLTGGLVAFLTARSWTYLWASTVGRQLPGRLDDVPR